jgi:N-acylneuraminate cytidylyltransferase
MSVVAIIPARGGSKRLPRKNIRSFGGRPVIAYPIERALESSLFSNVVVSTDDDEIAEVAVQYGAEAPFKRPAELSDDYAGTTAVIAHATRWATETYSDVDLICCIYPATPFLMTSDLHRAHEIMRTEDWDYCLSACEFASPIFRSFQARADRGLEMFFPDRFSARSQDLPHALHDAGQFYFGGTQAWLAESPLFGARSTFVELPRWRVHDIDTPDDWRRAELVWTAMRSSDPSEI